MDNLSDKQKMYLIIGVVVSILVIGILIYKSGKKKGSVEQAALPDDMPILSASGAKIGTLTTDQAKTVRELSQKLFTEIDSWGTVNDEPFKQLVELSDTLFVAVYNDYSKNYYSKTKKTLAQSISGLYSLGSYSTVTVGTSQLKETIMNRFAKLNLK
jgi:hypothetical protein